MKKLYLATVFCFVASFTWSSPGAIDQYGCHRDDTNHYHCHGDVKQAKKVHLLIGVAAKSTTWFYPDGPANFFIGPSLETELAFDTVAFHAGLAYQPLMFGANGYSLTGWDLGIKLGSGLSRIGKHGFVDIGYFHNPFKQADDNVTLLNGYQLGAGFIVNTEHWSFDGKLVYRDASKLKRFWNDEANITTDVINFGFSLAAYHRF